MQYRRFGATELSMPVLTCGGMRYQQSWQDIEPAALETASQSNLEATIESAVAAGITHIETARGYGSSEYQLGFVLNRFPRNRIMVQTKIGPKNSSAEFLETFETSMANLQLEYVDLLGVHGINTRALLDQTLHSGTLDACRQLQQEGRVRHVGFSTHAPTDVIVDAIESGAFSYVNLHWYYFDQRNRPAVEAAHRNDMGLFIISPSDKGGRLYDPPARLIELCAPFTPMGFNDLFCLSLPEVHTLSVGAARPADFEDHLAVMPFVPEADNRVAPVASRLHQALCETMGQDWAESWQEDLPTVVSAPMELPVYQILRLYTLHKAFDMTGYAKMRYNLLGNGGHWFPGQKAEGFDRKQLLEALGGYRFADRVPDILSEAHALFNEADQKRLSQS